MDDKDCNNNKARVTNKLSMLRQIMTGFLIKIKKKSDYYVVVLTTIHGHFLILSASRAL